MPDLTYEEIARRSCLNLAALGCRVEKPVRVAWEEIGDGRHLAHLAITLDALEWLLTAAGHGLAPALGAEAKGDPTDA